MNKPVRIFEDRSIEVPAGRTVLTGYVDMHKVRLACKERMAIGDVRDAYHKRLACGDRQPFPCPTGQWADDGFFEIFDGRHEYVATLMLGFEAILVAWVGNTDGRMIDGQQRTD